MSSAPRVPGVDSRGERREGDPQVLTAVRLERTSCR
jgi:hypothetical protein